MGASKTHQYSRTEIRIAKTANAMGHPARMRIIQLLKDHNQIRNTDLAKELELAKSTVNVHLKKLNDAELIQIQFIPNCYLIRLNKKSMNYIEECYTHFR